MLSSKNAQFSKIALPARLAVSLSMKSLKDVPANCFCESLLRTKFTCHIMHRALRVMVCENEAIFKIINATDSSIQNIVRVVCLCLLIFDN